MNNKKESVIVFLISPLKVILDQVTFEQNLLKHLQKALRILPN